MYQHKETKSLFYTSQQMYDLVMDIEKYPDFLPWCSSLEIVSRMRNSLKASMGFGYKSFSEKLLCRVDTNSEKQKIFVFYEKGPFKHLQNTWQFHNTEDGCIVDFYIEFQFKNMLLDIAVRPIFENLVYIMVDSFCKRADFLYRN